MTRFGGSAAPFRGHDQLAPPATATLTAAAPQAPTDPSGPTDMLATWVGDVSIDDAPATVDAASKRG